MSAAPTYLSLLSRNQGFRRLWLGQVVSFFGDWFKTIALYTIVQEITDSAQAIAAVMVMQMLPIFLMIPIAGPIVDRFDRRTVLLVTDVARAICVFGLLGAWWLESLPLLFGVLFVLVCFSGVFIPARTASIPQLTGELEMPVAMALSGGTWSVMLAFGAAIGGFVTEWIGIEGALLLDAATYLLSAYFLWGLPSIPPSDEDDADEAGLRAAFRYLRTRPYLTAVLSLKSAMAVSAAALVMLPIYGNGLFPLAGPLFIGLLYAFRGCGALVGSMGVRRWTGDLPGTMRALVSPGLLLIAGSLVFVAWAPSVWLAGVGFFAAAVGSGIVWVFSGTLAQMASDRAYRGRLFSMEFGAMTLVNSTMSWGGGALVDLAGWTPRQVVLASAVAVVVPAAAWPLALARWRPPA